MRSGLEGHRPQAGCSALSAAGPYTSAFFNPVLATSATFHCEGHTLLEYAQVYWLGPLAGKEGDSRMPSPGPFRAWTGLWD